MSATDMSLKDSGLLDECADLLDPLDPDQRAAIVNALSSGWLEGWRPNRADVGQLVARLPAHR